MRLLGCATVPAILSQSSPQEKRIRYRDLVTNAEMLHNGVGMTNALNDLRRDGVPGFPHPLFDLSHFCVSSGGPLQSAHHQRRLSCPTTLCTIAKSWTTSALSLACSMHSALARSSIKRLNKTRQCGTSRSGGRQSHGAQWPGVYQSRAALWSPDSSTRSPRIDSLRPVLPLAQRNDDALGRALETLYTYGVTALYSLIAVRAAKRLGLAPTLAPLDTHQLPCRRTLQQRTRPRTNRSCTSPVAIVGITDPICIKSCWS